MHVVRVFFWGATLALASTVGPGLNAAQFPRVITGVVRDAAGEGLPGVLVEWGYFTAAPDDRQTVTTGAGGKFRLVTAKVGRDFRLGFSKRGYSPAWYDRVVPGPAAKPSDFAVTLKKAPKLSVRLQTKAGAPVTGLRVTALTPSNGFHASFSTPTPATPLPGKSAELTTDENGEINFAELPAMPAGGRLSGPAGEERSPNWLMLHLTSGKGGFYYERQITEEEALRAQPVILQIPDYQRPRTPDELRGVVRGRVVDAETDEPITKFSITRRFQPEARVVDDADGRFEIGPALRIGDDYQVRVFVPGYAVAVANLPAVAPESDALPKIMLAHHKSFEGRVVDAESGAPLAGVAVLAGFVAKGQFAYIEDGSIDTYADGHHCLSNVLRATTDAEGRFAIPEVPGEPVSLILQREGYGMLALRAEQRPPAGEDGLTVIPLAREAQLTAVAIRETPLGGAAGRATLYYRTDDGFQRISSQAMALDDEGRATFKGLSAGEYSIGLKLRSDDADLMNCAKRVTVVAGQRRAVLLGALPGTLRLRGRAQPFSFVQLRPKFESEITTIGVEVEVDGEFEINHLEPGEYEVELNISSASSGFISDIEPKLINLTEDQSIVLQP